MRDASDYPVQELSSSKVTVVKPRVRTNVHRTGSGAGRLELVAIGEGIVARVPLPDTGEVSIGRSKDADARIDADSISRRHALLRIDDGTLTIEDLGSANGTSVRGTPIDRGARVPIKVGEVIDLGSVLVTIQRHTAGERPRRIWTHAFFEAHLEEECLRAGEAGTSFAVLAVQAGAPCDDTIARAVRTADVVGVFVPGEYEVILVGGGATDADRIAKTLRGELGRGVRIGIALYPRDGRDPDALLAAARAAIAGADRPPRIASGGAMDELHRLVERVAQGTISVLILGETGVGKEVLAESVHRASKRSAQAFLKLNCAALSESLLESELFGHERGSFTGATGAKQGLLETADGGTVFLDEVGELPLAIQAKLLRVIEERAVLRVGGLKTKAIDVRFVAATNRDLEAEIARGTFRQDLYFRLNGVSLMIPPLRERIDEIAGLARAFVASSWQKLERDGAPPRLAPEALAMLEGYGWPGNIRELRNVIERAVLLSTDGAITPEQLPAERLRGTRIAAAPPEPDRPLARSTGTLADSVKKEVEAVEKQRILDALDQCAGNQTHAAKLLGISRATFVNRLDLYGIKRPRKPRS
jgi:two-component system, NtrC family, response regulator AtoC